MEAVLNQSIEQMTRLLVEAAHPKRIILFGSYARGDATEDSDFDVMVIQASVQDRLREMVRLNRIVRPLHLPIDLLVVSEENYNYWRETPGNVYFEAASDGRVLYEEP
jgi:predicted nucleotidyltransferase